MGNLFERACAYAIKKHSGQMRKDGSMYILHPLEVATIASSITNNETVLASAVLHDVVEDTNTNILDIRDLFGDDVFEIIKLESEDKYENISKDKSWRTRKEEAIKRLMNSNNEGFKIIYLCDKLSNMRSLYREYKRDGYEVFKKFNNSDIYEQAWYYYSILYVLSDYKDLEPYKELEDKINYIFNDYRKENNNGKDSRISK